MTDPIVRPTSVAIKRIYNITLADREPGSWLLKDGITKKGRGGSGHGSGVQDSALYGAYTLVSRILIALYYL